MEKLIYLIWARDEAGRAEAQRRLMHDAVPELLALEPRGLTLYANDADADVPAPVPWPADELPLVADVGIWLDCYQRRGRVEEILAGVGARIAGYLVSESLYTDYGGNRHAASRDWPDGVRSPGVVMVTLMEKPDRLTHDEWITHWHETQSPVSEEMQPRTRYVRNLVVRALTPEAPPYRGIVEEAWPSADHVTDPMLFYGAGGSKETMQRNIGSMLESVRGFLDLERIRSQTTSEYILKSG